jgi:hypothetical protein
MTSRLIYCVALVALSSIAVSADQERLASAKSLYESASYESALKELAAISDEEFIDAADTYRALCLLGLGRGADAEGILAAMVSRRPLLTLSDADYSPRLVLLFDQVRQRTLPRLAQQYYGAAKADFQNENYDAAAAGFKKTLDVIAAVKGPNDALSDLRTLSEGFVALATSKHVAAAPPQPAAPPPVEKPAAPVEPAVYTLLDSEVTPPVAVDQRMPTWHAGVGPQNRMFRGQMELLIDESGGVESATIVETVWKPYDVLLLKASKTWRYQPAVKDGKPVRFRRVLDIVIAPSTAAR